jgi:hypothetical protein
MFVRPQHDAPKTIFGVPEVMGDVFSYGESAYCC